MDNTGILIIAAAIVLVVILLRDRITKFGARASLKDQDGNINIEAAKPQKPQVTPPDSHSVVISRNKNIGRDNAIEVDRGDVAVTDNTQLGQNQRIIVNPETEGKKK